MEDAGVRQSLVDVVEALESLPVKVTRENPALRHVFLGEDPPVGMAEIKALFRRHMEPAEGTQGEGIWGFGGLYTQVTGTIKSRGGLTKYGETDPLEDWADTWRILVLPDVALRREFSVSHLTGNEYDRFRIMRQILKGAGLEVFQKNHEMAHLQGSQEGGYHLFRSRQPLGDLL